MPAPLLALPCHWGIPGGAEGKEEEKEEKGLRVIIALEKLDPSLAARTKGRCASERKKERRKGREERGTKEDEREEEREEWQRGARRYELAPRREKKKVKVQRGRKQPVQVQVFYYARLSRLWHSCFEEPGNLGWTEWGVSGYPARSPISLSLASPLLLRHGFVASEHPLILFCRVKLRN